MRFILSEEDAQKYGCPREVEFDDSRFSGREAIALKKLTGWSYERFGQAFEGERVVDEDGQQVWQLDDGAPAKDEAGQKIPLKSVDAEAILIALWLAVRRAVGDVPWKTFNVNLVGLEEVTEEDEGKAETPTTTG
jgi:hypothetical protein